MPSIEHEWVTDSVVRLIEFLVLLLLLLVLVSFVVFNLWLHLLVSVLLVLFIVVCFFGPTSLVEVGKILFQLMYTVVFLRMCKHHSITV